MTTYRDSPRRLNPRIPKANSSPARHNAHQTDHELCVVVVVAIVETKSQQTAACIPTITINSMARMKHTEGIIPEKINTIFTRCHPITIRSAAFPIHTLTMFCVGEVGRATRIQEICNGEPVRY